MAILRSVASASQAVSADPAPVAGPATEPPDCTLSDSWDIPGIGEKPVRQIETGAQHLARTLRQHFHNGRVKWQTFAGRQFPGSIITKNRKHSVNPLPGTAFSTLKTLKATEERSRCFFLNIQRLQQIVSVLSVEKGHRHMGSLNAYFGLGSRMPDIAVALMAP